MAWEVVAHNEPFGAEPDGRIRYIDRWEWLPVPPPFPPGTIVQTLYPGVTAMGTHPAYHRYENQPAKGDLWVVVGRHLERVSHYEQVEDGRSLHTYRPSVTLVTLEAASGGGVGGRRFAPLVSNIFMAVVQPAVKPAGLPSLSVDDLVAHCVAHLFAYEEVNGHFPTLDDQVAGPLRALDSRILDRR